MSKFIEVTSIGGAKEYINVDLIECVINSIIYMAFIVPNSIEQEYIMCQETYEEIKALINGSREVE